MTQWNARKTVSAWLDRIRRSERSERKRDVVSLRRFRPSGADDQSCRAVHPVGNSRRAASTEAHTVDHCMTTISGHVDAIVERVVRHRMLRGWTPIDQRLTLVVEGSDDVGLGGLRRNAVIRAYDLDGDGALTRLLVQLDCPFVYCTTGQSTPSRDREREIEWLVAEPRLGLPRPSRLLLFMWWHAVVVDAPSFADCIGRHPIGIARLRRLLMSNMRPKR